MCKEEATQYCNLLEYSEKLDNAVVQMVLERYNRMKNEGIDSTNASGIHETFHDGYTASTMSMLRKNRKVALLRSSKEIEGSEWGSLDSRGEKV